MALGKKTKTLKRSLRKKTNRRRRLFKETVPSSMLLMSIDAFAIQSDK